MADMTKHTPGPWVIRALLEALKDCAYQLKMTGEDRPEISEALASAKIAIAKAEGGGLMANHAIDVIARDPYAQQNAILRDALIAIKDRALLAEGMPTELVRADMREIASVAVYALTQVTKTAEGGAA